MVVLLFVSRRILLAGFSIASTLVIHVAALALIPSGTFGGRLGDMLRDLTNTDYANRVSQSSVSLSSFVGRGICWLSPETVCGSGIFPRNVLPFNPAVFGILISLVLLSIWLLTLWSYGKKDERVVVLFLAWLVLSIPESQSYNLVLLSAAFLVVHPCLIGRKDDHGSASSGNNGLSLSKIPDVLLAVALATSLVPLPLFVFSSGVGFPISLSGVGSTRWPMIVPGFWLLAFLAQAAKLTPGLMQSVVRGASPLGRLRSRG